MIIKHQIELVATGLTKAIGSPEDIDKNLEKGNFIIGTDLSIPNTDEKPSSLEEGMGGIDLNEQKRISSGLDRVQKALEDQFMPIKALNQFTTDWRFKARIVKKPPMREYRNQKG